ncbi:DUF4232 domain-containing protein [Streptomyces sp. Q6]|uniref:DUF4232 domain-containing protein n=1 Tax=Streptomyces citrinus TaxID=3118173 RepID=A0ACD5AQZ0_9ACTN
MKPSDTAASESANSGAADLFTADPVEAVRDSGGLRTRGGRGRFGAPAAVALAGTALVALSACGGTPSQSAPSASPVAHAARQQGTSRCTAAHLRPAVAASEGAAGSVSYDLTLTNTGDSACALKGYPGCP